MIQKKVIIYHICRLEEKMKIIMSPSKTKSIAGKGVENHFAMEKREQIIEHMRGLSVEDIMKALKIKEELAQKVKAFYLNYKKEKSGAAIASFNGLAFKNLQWECLSSEAKAFGEEHLIILSALYGVLKPMDAVKDYRLDLVNLIHKYGESEGFSEGLTKFWKSEVSNLLAKEDWILNVASQEYSALVEHPQMVTVSFLEKQGDQWKQKSTSSKMMRGQFVHYILENKVSQKEDLPREIGDFKRDVSMETENSIVYKKM